MADWDIVSQEPVDPWSVVDEKSQPPQQRREQEAGEWPGGASGWLKASAAGTLHGITGLTGLPADVTLGLARQTGRALTLTPEQREQEREALKRKFETQPKRGRRAEAERAPPTPGEEFVSQYVEPALPTSQWQRRMLDVPGHALGLEGRATYNDIKEVPEQYRGPARFGEGIGSQLPFSWGAGAAGRLMPRGGLGASETVSPSVIRNIINSQVEDQARYAARTGAATSLMPKSTQRWSQIAADAWKPVSPFHHLGAQRAPGIGAGLGAAAAEEVAPGSDLAQFVGQLGGGLTGAAASQATKGTMNRLAARFVEPLSTLTEEGQKAAIARALKPQFEQYGEDPANIIKRLNTPDEIPGALPAERSGSRVLMGAQKTLAQEDDVLANTIKNQEEAFRGRLQGQVDDVTIREQQGQLSQAARDYDDTIKAQLSQAEQDVYDLTRNIQRLSPVEQESVSNQAAGILERALQRARTQERNLWSQTPDEAPVNPSNAIREYDAVTARMLREDRLPGNTDAVIERWRELGPDEGVPLWEVRAFRSNVLAQATEARAKGDFDLARRLSQIANGESTPGVAGRDGGALADMSAVGDPAVQNARNFSVLLNDRFTRSFAGDLLGMNPEGGPAIRSGLTLETAFSGNRPMVAQKIRELREAEAPVTESPMRPAANLGTEMGQAQERYLQNQVVEKVLTPDGRVRLGTAENFMRDNAQVLDQFPAVREQLDAAILAERAAQAMAVKVSDKDKMQVFAKLIAGGEKPADAVGRMLGGANPVRDLQEMSRLARRAGPDAVAGLRASILAHVSDRAKGSFATMRDMLTKPFSGRPRDPSLVQLMENDGLISADQRIKLIGSLELGARHETAAQKAVRITSVGDEAGQNLRWGARFIGAKLAGWLGATSGSAGTSLQAAAIGASAAENALMKAPVARAREILREAMTAEDPQKLIDILEKISGPSVKFGQKGLSQPELISLLRPMFPRTSSEGIDKNEPTQWERMNWRSVIGIE